MNEGKQYDYLLKCPIHYSEVSMHKCFMHRSGEYTTKEQYAINHGIEYHKCVIYLDNLELKCCYHFEASVVGYMTYICFGINGTNCQIYVPFDDFLKKPHFWTKNTLRQHKIKSLNL